MPNENTVVTDHELLIVRVFLKKPEHPRLYICNEHPHKFKILNHV